MTLRLSVSTWVNGHVDEAWAIHDLQTFSHSFLQLWNGLAEVTSLAKEFHHFFIADIYTQACWRTPAIYQNYSV